MSFYNGNKRFKKTSLTDLEWTKMSLLEPIPFLKEQRQRQAGETTLKTIDSVFHVPGSSTIVF